MTRLLTFASVLAVLTFFWGADQPQPGAAHATQACPPNPSPPDAADPSMILDQPASGDSVTSPVIGTSQTRLVNAALVGTVRFRDSPILVFADSGGTIA